MARGLAQPDRFANIAAGDVTMSAANTLTFQEILTGISLGVGVGMLIDQIDYTPTSASIRELLGNADALFAAWTTSNGVSDIADASDRRVLHAFQEIPTIVGAVVSLAQSRWPAVYQFFPPIIVAAPRIFVAMNTSGAAAASRLRSRMYFRFVELSAQEYLEIAETFQLTS